MNESRMHALTRALIEIDSVTPNEHEIQRFLESELARRGLRTRLFEVLDDRCNLLATYGPDPPRVLFNTHVDTVPPQYGPYEDAHRIYGRGACDTHGILAAILEAMALLHKKGLSDLGLLLTVDEEGGQHRGARHAGRHLAPPRTLIVGEPTENRLMSSQKGLLKADLTARGTTGHSGYPERADDALQRLLGLLTELTCQPWLTRDSQTGNTLNIIIKEGGAAYNKVPELARAGLFFRLVDPMADIRRRVDRLLRDRGDDQVEIAWLGGNDPVDHLETLPGFESGVAAYNTDIAALDWPQTRTFLLGPGSIHQAHRDPVGEDWASGEWIDKTQQASAVDLYVRLVERALGSDTGD